MDLQMVGLIPLLTEILEMFIEIHLGLK